MTLADGGRILAADLQDRGGDGTGSVPHETLAWDTSTGAEMLRIRRYLYGLSADGRTLVCGDAYAHGLTGLTAYRVADGSQLGACEVIRSPTISDPAARLLSPDGRRRAVLSPDGRTLALHEASGRLSL